MRRACVAAAGFALAEGLAADPGAVVHVSPGPDAFGRILLACVEPLELSARGFELAAVALRTIRETFAAMPGTPAETLLTAFAAANAAVIAENRPLATGRWSRQICVGATGVALAGREIVVAQAAPTQAIFVQDGQVYAFPDVASWRGDYAPDARALESQPLGLVEDLTPRLHASEAEPGDLIALCSTSIGRALGRDEEHVIELFGGSLLTSDLEGSIDRLERLSARYEVLDAFAVVSCLTRLPGRSRLRLALPARPRPIGRARGRHVVRAREHRSSPPDDMAQPSPAPLMSAYVADEGPPPVESMRQAAIKVAELLTPPQRSAAPRFAARTRAMAAPGALSVSRYRESPGLPPEWRALLPRGPGVHVPARLLAVSLALFLTIGGTGFAVERQRDREAQSAAALVAADVALKGALEIPGSATSLVTEAEAALASARAAGASGEPLVSREREYARVRDQVWKVERLNDVVRLGALPGELGHGRVSLAISGNTLYVAAGNLYELDASGERLVTLLEQGDEVAGGVAGDLRDVSIDGGKLVAGDGDAIYVREETGHWERRDLAVADVGGMREGIPLLVWGDATYGLSWDGNIIRFEASPVGTRADVWAPAEDNPDLALAQDLAIDGRIHVLLQDGRTLTFSRGALVGSLSPFVMPALNKAAFLAQAPFATDFYVVDPQTSVGENVGRIVRCDASGAARQYLTPDGDGDDPAGDAVARALQGAQDMAIDELTGTVYWVSGNEIWRARMPLT